MLRSDFSLRDVSEDDLQTLLRWRNSDRIRMNMFTDHIITWAEHCAWYERLKIKSDRICKIFAYRERPIGVVNYTEIDLEALTCFWGFYLGETDIPSGCGSILGFNGLEFAFEELNVRKISGEALGFNAASVKFHNRLGFQKEGLFRKHVVRNGEYVDVVRFALFRDTWLEKKPSLQANIFSAK